MSTDLVHVSQLSQNQALMQTGGLGIDISQVKVAPLILVQRTTTIEGAEEGKFLDKLSMNHHDEMQIVPMAIKEVRGAYFPPGGDLKAKPLCWSSDGVVPSDLSPAPQSETCKNCPRGDRMWNRKTGAKPACPKKFRMLFVDRVTQLPYIINVGGASFKGLKERKDAIIRDYLANKAKGVVRNIFDYTLLMKAAKVQGKKGVFYVINFLNLRAVQNPGEFGALFEQYVLRQQALEADAITDDTIDGEIVESTGIEEEAGPVEA